MGLLRWMHLQSQTYFIHINHLLWFWAIFQCKWMDAKDYIEWEHPDPESQMSEVLSISHFWFQTSVVSLAHGETERGGDTNMTWHLAFCGKLWLCVYSSSMASYLIPWRFSQDPPREIVPSRSWNLGLCVYVGLLWGRKCLAHGFMCV